MASLLQTAKLDVGLSYFEHAVPSQSTRIAIISEVTHQLELAAWHIIASKWNDVLLRIWIVKTFRYRDLRAVWIQLFGKPPADVTALIGGA